jgi:biotin carboxyl carrier protein
MRYVILRDNKEVPAEIVEQSRGYRITLGDKSYDVDSVRVVGNLYSLAVSGKSYEATVHKSAPDEFRVHLYDGMRVVTLLTPLDLALRGKRASSGASHGSVRAPMPGRVVKVLVKEGDAIEKGTGLVVVEAMKMQNELCAAISGTVKAVKVSEGDSVERNAELVVIE